VSEKVVSLSGEDARHAARLLSMLIAPEATASPDTNPSAAEVQKRLDPIKERAAFAAKASLMLHERRRRASYFNPVMFAEAAWDVLLALYVADFHGSRLSVGRLIEWTGAPSTTALRWVDYLEERQYVTRRTAEVDKRIVYVDLLERGRETLNSYFREILSKG